MSITRFSERGTVTIATPDKPNGSGGTEVTSGGYKYHTFTSSPSTFTVNADGPYEVLVIGGGGGGTYGGGGAGGAASATFYLRKGEEIDITVGAGATGMAQGNDSSFGDYLTGNGGGRGATTVRSSVINSGGIRSGEAVQGGCGGGGGGYHGGPSDYYYGANYGRRGIEGYSGGNYGGSPHPNTRRGSGAGGGGMGGNGSGGSVSTAGNGGIGTADYTDWGAATSTGEDNGSGTYYYCGGGSGNAVSPYVLGLRIFGTGGLGGGGGGNGGSGTANTGGGGAGGAANGGSGLVIVRYGV